MDHANRRAFLAEVGQGMSAVLMGSVLARELGVAVADTDERDKPDKRLDQLAKQLQETSPEKLLGVFTDRLDNGVTLRTMIAAGALANARAFAGQDYDGYHTFMALTPAFTIASELPAKERPLPIYKVLYRNATQISHTSRHHHDHLGEPDAIELGKQPIQDMLNAQRGTAQRGQKVKTADRIVSALFETKKRKELYDDIQPLVHDTLNVHKIVLAWRAWEILDFTGEEHARTMLRQTVRHCADYTNHGVGHETNRFRGALPKLLEEHRLLNKKVGTKKADDAWIEKLARTIYADSKDTAAQAVAEALVEGFSADSITEAVSLAATMLVLSDRGSGKGQGGRPVGSVHGASVGVHASDAANAWRHVAAATSTRNTICSLLAAAYHTAGQTSGQMMPKPLPLTADVDAVTEKDAAKLLGALDEAIRGRDQKRACAVVQKYGTLGHDAKDVFPVLRRYGISEDGALHAEKYYRTIREEFARSRPAFRWHHLIALARVTASEYGTPAPGLAEARKRFGL